jgi:glutamyl-tRNA synthetase
MQDALGIRQVDIWDFSRLNFKRTVLSKRKLTTLVEKGVVWGWDDPRMPSIRGVCRRGVTIPALREFILKQGPSQNIVSMDWTKFFAINKKYIDPIALRHTAIPKQDAVTARVGGIEATSFADKPKHAKNADLGTKKVIFSREIIMDQKDAQLFKLNEEITLMNWGNAVITNISTDPSTGTVSTLHLELHMEGDVKKTEKKVTWLAKEPSNMIPVELVSFDYLITKDKIEKGEDITPFITPQSEFRTRRGRIAMLLIWWRMISSSLIGLGFLGLIESLEMVSRRSCSIFPLGRVRKGTRGKKTIGIVFSDEVNQVENWGPYLVFGLS